MIIRIKRINNEINSPLPVYATEYSSGMDIASSSYDDIIILPFETAIIPTNLSIEIPHGYEGQIRPRSGLAMKHNIGIINSPGTIDSDFRGELKVLLTNFGKQPFTVRFGDRIAQLVICKIEKADIQISDTLSSTERGEGGFGHSGIKSDGD